MWIFEGKKVHTHDDLLPGCTNFVYVIHYTNGKKYIGKKIVVSERRLKPTKKQLKIRKNYVRKEIVQIKFAEYKGSHELSNGLAIKCKEILYQCSTKKAATYLEVALMFHYNVLFGDEYFNKNISGTFFDNSLDGLLN